MKKVIIVGASYAGLYATKKLALSSDVEVLLIDKNSYHYIQVESYGFVATKYKASDVTVNTSDYIKNLNANVKFYKNEVLSFDSVAKTVTTGDKETHSYDELIIATGSLTNFPPQVPNIEKYSRGIKTLQRASEVEQTFDKVINDANWQEKSDAKKSYNMVIGGAGLSGVEIAAEMANLLKKHKSKTNTEAYAINIIIVDGMPTVLPGMDERLVTACQERLEDLGIQIHLGSFIKDVDESKIYLMNDVEIEYDYFVFTGGVKAITLNSDKEYEVNKLNQYVVNDKLQLLGEDNIHVIGDAAQIMIGGKYFPPTAQIAIKAGEYVATAITSNSNENFDFKSSGVLVSLGGCYAIGLANDKYFIKGLLAHVLKKVVTTMHKRKFI
ncbi:hypothetical protein A9Q76_01240 [Arcobacter sp. 31_11_sub10_T18]|nr:hypothetical protein A9Q76_01240 [Arcobacter sp. 31_11_sub10_T18]